MEAFVLVRIEKRKIYEEVAALITEQITSGELKEGERLPSIQALSKAYGVGQASIREALNALRVTGLVDIKHGEGTFVKSASPRIFTPEFAKLNHQDVLDLLEMRMIVETGAVQLAAHQHSELQLNGIEKALLRMKDAMNEKDAGEASDFEFHMAIAKATNNTLLEKLLLNLSEIMFETMRETRKIWLYTETKSIEKIYFEHQEIFEAIKARDGKKAEKVMRRHLTGVAEVLITHLK